MKRLVILVCLVGVLCSGFGGCGGSQTNSREMAKQPLNAGCVVDPNTGLTWQKWPSLYSYSREDAEVFLYFTRSQENIDWRLPTMNELSKFKEFVITHQYFSGEAQDFWTSERNESGYPIALRVNRDKTLKQFVRMSDTARVWFCF